MNDDIEASIAVGHNGMVHIVSNPDRTIDIENCMNHYIMSTKKFMLILK